MNEETAQEIAALQHALNMMLKIRRQWKDHPKLQTKLDEGILHTTIQIYELRHPE